MQPAVLPEAHLEELEQEPLDFPNGGNVLFPATKLHVSPFTQNKMAPEASMAPESVQDQLRKEFENAFDAERSIIREKSHTNPLGKMKHEKSPLADFMKKKLFRTSDRNTVLRMLTCSLNDPSKVSEYHFFFLNLCVCEYKKKLKNSQEGLDRSH